MRLQGGTKGETRGDRGRTTAWGCHPCPTCLSPLNQESLLGITPVIPVSCPGEEPARSNLRSPVLRSPTLTGAVVCTPTIKAQRHGGADDEDRDFGSWKHRPNAQSDAGK